MDKAQSIEWGCACAAYQVEGAYNIDGKGSTLDSMSWNNIYRAVDLG
jgi:beta-glucosidase/6-phospho-beta-glucosidase/beta-galactosidase